MKIAFDLHGVLETNPVQFKSLITFLRSMGNKVVLISGPPVHQIIQELKNLEFSIWNLYFDEIYSVVDYLRTHTNAAMNIDLSGNWWTDDVSWWSSKSKICKIEQIDVLIDNSLGYKEYFDDSHPTNFVLLETVDFDVLLDSIIYGLK